MGFEAEMFNSTDSFTFRKLHLGGRQDLKYFQSQNVKFKDCWSWEAFWTECGVVEAREGERGEGGGDCVAVTVRWPGNSQSAWDAVSDQREWEGTEWDSGLSYQHFLSIISSNTPFIRDICQQLNISILPSPVILQRWHLKMQQNTIFLNV